MPLCLWRMREKLCDLGAYSRVLLKAAEAHFIAAEAALVRTPIGLR